MQRVGTQYAKNLSCTQTSNFTFKISNFYQKHSKCDEQCLITLKHVRARFDRAFFFVISAFFNLNIDFARSKTRKPNKQTHKS